MVVLGKMFRTVVLPQRVPQFDHHTSAWGPLPYTSSPLNCHCIPFFPLIRHHESFLVEYSTRLTSAPTRRPSAVASHSHGHLHHRHPAPAYSSEIPGRASCATSTSSHFCNLAEVTERSCKSHFHHGRYTVRCGKGACSAQKTEIMPY